MFSYALTHSGRKTAALFRVGPNTVHVLKKLFIETGQLAPKPSHVGRPRAISAEGELYLQALLREEADLALEELCERYADTYGVTVSVGTMFNTLRRLRITRKKSTDDPQKNRPEHQAQTEHYHHVVDAIPFDQRLYLDETGARLNMTLPYGRAHGANA